MGNNPIPPTGSKGRPPGSVNRATANAREAIANFVDGNVDRLYGWLDAIANGEEGPEGWIRKPDPKSAFDCYMNVVEYHIPKLARTEQQFLNKDGQPSDASITVKYVD